MRQLLTSKQDKTVAGVDGCAGGWLLATRNQTPALFSTFRQLLLAHPKTILLVDIPMGLPSLSARDLESQARKLLPCRSSSLFPVPCRDAVYAASYGEACDINLRYLGKKLSKQTWNICSKIREVDELLCDDSSWQARIVESHPELAFFLLSTNGTRYSKKTAEGVEERLDILEGYYQPVRRWYQLALETYPRKLVARDDILDALVLMVVGSVGQTVLTDSCGADEMGLRIRMALPECRPG